MGKQLNVENSVVSAKDDALFYNAMIQKNGVWKYGNELNYEIISANQINIKDGFVTAQGRNYVIYPNEVDSLTIENGKANTKRHDLIVYEVSKTSEGEKVGLKVVKGTNATTPVDPNLIQEDTLASGSIYQMPLYRVRLNGINVEGVDDLRELIDSFSNGGQGYNPNLLINGDFQVWQRGDNFTSIYNQYTADRWLSMQVNTKTTSVEKSTDVPPNTPFKYSAKITDNTSENARFRQIFETNLKAGVTYTLSFYAKTTDEFRVRTLVVEGGLENSQNIKGTGNWEYYVFTFTCNSEVRGIEMLTDFVGTVYFAGIKLEQGPVATSFIPRLYAEEFALCQRFYQVHDSVWARRISNNWAKFYLPVIMRTAPTLIGTIKQYSLSGTEWGTVASSDIFTKDNQLNFYGTGTADWYVSTEILSCDAEIY